MSRVHPYTVFVERISQVWGRTRESGLGRKVIAKKYGLYVWIKAANERLLNIKSLGQKLREPVWMGIVRVWMPVRVSKGRTTKQMWEENKPWIEKKSVGIWIYKYFIISKILRETLEIKLTIKNPGAIEKIKKNNNDLIIIIIRLASAHISRYHRQHTLHAWNYDEQRIAHARACTLVICERWGLINHCHKVEWSCKSHCEPPKSWLTLIEFAIICT